MRRVSGWIEGGVRGGVAVWRRSLKARSTFFYASSSLICQALRLVGVTYSTRLLGAEEFGLLAQSMVVIGLAGLLREWGQGTALIARPGDDLAHARFHFQTQWVGGLLGAGLIWLALVPLGLGPGALARVATLVAAVYLVETLGITGQLMMQKRFRFRGLGAIEIASLLAWLGTIVLFAGRIAGFELLLWARLWECAIRTALTLIAEGWRHVGWACDRALARYYALDFGRYCAPELWLQAIAAQIETVLLSVLAGTAQAGVYERLQQFLRIPVSASVNLVDKVAMASYSAAQHDRAQMRRDLWRFNLLLMAMSLGIIVAVSLMLPAYLEFFVGRGWREELVPLWLLAIPLSALTPLTCSLSILLRGIGRVRALLATTVVGSCVKLVVALVVTAAWGAGGMVIAVTVSYTAMAFYQLRAVRLVLDEPGDRAATDCRGTF